MEKLNQYMEFMKEAELLKGVLRSAWSSKGRQESTAEHSWRLALLAGIMLEDYPQLDSGKVFIMCLIHDLGEIYDGDIPAILLPDSTLKLEMEKKDVDKILSLLPSKLKTKYMSIWLEYGKEYFEKDELLMELRKKLDSDTNRHLKGG